MHPVQVDLFLQHPQRGDKPYVRLGGCTSGWLFSFLVVFCLFGPLEISSICLESQAGEKIRKP